MKKIILFLLLSLLIPSTWQDINSSVPTPMNAELISSDINNTKIKFTMDGFHLIEIDDKNSDIYIIKSENERALTDIPYIIGKIGRICKRYEC